MNHHTDYLKQAEFALAAYANLVTEIPNQDELKEAEFSTSQARTFADTYRVVTQHTDTTGLSATVFANKVSGETFLAVRGTEASDIRDSSFKVGTSAMDADDYILYNKMTGALLYDEDGNGTVASVQIATLSAGLAMTNADIVVI